MRVSDNLVDPLLVLLRRHEAANSAYDAAADSDASEAERNHLFAACRRTMQAIIDRAPAATTAESAAAALDHVLNEFLMMRACGTARSMPARYFFASLLRPRVTTSSGPPRNDRCRPLRHERARAQVRASSLLGKRCSDVAKMASARIRGGLSGKRRKLKDCRATADDGVHFFDRQFVGAQIADFIVQLGHIIHLI
jgi:hypothetical protein